MQYTKTRVHGSFVIDLEPRCDQRGFFARAWCAQELAAQGLTARISQISVSFNAHKGTLRGMHLQRRPFEEAKIIACTRGMIHDVVLDLRPDSPTYLRWDAAELTADNRRRLYVPEGCAHGFQTLSDASEVLYVITEQYSPAHARGVRHDDPTFGISWPLPVTCISDADKNWPVFDPREIDR